MKHESDESGIIVYDMHDDYSLGRSSKPKKTTGKEEKPESHEPNPEENSNKSLALLGGFSGRVYDKLTYRTIEGALVTIAKDLSIKTDEKGIFTATGIKPGKYRITVFEEGYVAQSCKSSAIAGETTKLDSFHLIPDCLVAEYPDEIAQEEEETVEEELVEFALEAPQSTPSEMSTHKADAIREETTTKKTLSDKLPEQVARVSSDIAGVENVRGTTSDVEISVSKAFPAIEEITEVPDGYIEIIAAAIEEKKDAFPDEIIAVILEQIQTAEITKNVIEVVIPVPEETEAPIDEPFVTEFSFSPLETVIAEVRQPEKTLEKVQEETLQEIALKDAPSEIATKVRIQEEVGKVVSQEKSVESSAEEDSQETTPPLILWEQPLVSYSEVIPETAVEEMVQSQEAAQAPAGEKSRLGKLWKSLRNKIAKELELTQDLSIETSMGEDSQETVLSPEQQEQQLIPHIEAASGIEEHELILEKPLEVTHSVEAPFDEMLVSIASGESIETAISISEEQAVDGIELPHIPAEIIAVSTEHQQDEVPQELQGDKAPTDKITLAIVAGELTEEKLKEEVPQEDLPAPLLESAPEITAQEEIDEKEPMESLAEPFLKSITPENVLEETNQQEQSFVDVSLQEITTPAIFPDLTEAILTEPEETVAGDIFFIDQLPHVFVETDIIEVTQPEKVLLETSGEESPIESAAEEMTQEEIKEDIYHEQPPEPPCEVSSEISTGVVVLEEAHKEESLEPLLDVALNLTSQEEIAEIAPPAEAAPQTVSQTTPREVLQEVPEEGSGTKLVWWTRRKKKTRTGDQAQSLDAEVTLTTIETSITESTQREEITRDLSTKKAPLEKASIEAIEEETVQEAAETKVSREKPSFGVSDEETLEDLSEDDFASISDEEKEAMSRGHDSAEVEGFIGIINAQPNPAYKGLPINIAYTLRNVACDNPDDYIVQIKVSNPDTGIIHDTLEIPVNCSKGTFLMGGFVIFTTLYETHVYRLIMKIVSKKTKTPHLLADIPLEIKTIY